MFSKETLCGFQYSLNLKNPCAVSIVRYGQSENRTRKVLLPADFESAASTSSAIRPGNYYYAIIRWLKPADPNLPGIPSRWRNGGGAPAFIEVPWNPSGGGHGQSFPPGVNLKPVS